MLEILEQKDLTGYAGRLPERPSDTVHVSEAIENGRVIGYIIYAYTPQQVEIYAVEDGHDWNYCDGLVRSVLFKAQLRGLDRARFAEQDPAMVQRLTALGFIKNDENILENIADIMDSCKKCKENPANT